MLPVMAGVATFAGGGSPGGTASGHADAIGTSATFNNPHGIAVDGAGTKYVADYGNALIRKITSGGAVTTLAGGGSPGGTSPGYADGTGTSAEFLRRRVWRSMETAMSTLPIITTI